MSGLRKDLSSVHRIIKQQRENMAQDNQMIDKHMTKIKNQLDMRT